jgi:hypothetical protein
MDLALKIGGAFLVLIGGVWFLQGVDLLLDSPASGQTRWAIFGALLMVGGIILLVKDRSASY